MVGFQEVIGGAAVFRQPAVDGLAVYSQRRGNKSGGGTMSEMNPKPQSLAFKIGWGILLFFSIGNVLGHITLSLIESGPPTVFIAWAGFNFLAAGILLIPYRRGEKWAWFIIWV
jgi:hypothetical protein